MLHVIDSLAYGGAEASLVALAPALRARGVDLGVAMFGEETDYSAALAERGTRVYSVDEHRRTERLRALHDLIKKLEPHIVHTSLFEAGVIGRLASAGSGARVVSSLVSTPYGPRRTRDAQVASWKVRLTQLIDAATARRVHRFHAVAEHVADTMARRLWLRRSRIDVVHRGRDPAELGERRDDRRVRVRTQLHCDQASPLVVAIGRHEHAKGLDVLVRATERLCRELADVRVVIAGRRGSRTAALETEIRTRRLSDVVTLLGPRDDVPDILAAADLFVLPSRWEGLPNALIEAIGIGVPVVATDLPGVREVVGDGLALVAPEDDNMLSESMVHALRTPDRRASNALHQRFLESFTLDAAADGMRSLYDRALAGR